MEVCGWSGGVWMEWRCVDDGGVWMMEVCGMNDGGVLKAYNLPG